MPRELIKVLLPFARFFIFWQSPGYADLSFGLVSPEHLVRTHVSAYYPVTGCPKKGSSACIRDRRFVRISILKLKFRKHVASIC